jgi:hypothetical protein
VVESTNIPEDEPYDEEDKATRALMDKYSYLEGKLYIDNKNKRLYMVTDLVWDTNSQLLCTMRPPEEADKFPYIITGGDPLEDVAVRVKAYEEQKARIGGVISPMTELTVRKAQRRMEDIKPIWILLDGMEYDDKGIKELTHNRRTYIDKVGMALRLREVVQVQNTLTYIKQTVHPIVLPRMWRATAIQQFHNKMGHPGARRMLSTIGRYYTWSGMRSDIHHFCQTCIQCQKRMSANQIVKNPKTSIYPFMTRPFERVHIDLFGELPTTNGGHRYVLVFKCALTK